MASLSAFFHRLRVLVRPRQLEQDLDDELAFHLAMREAEHQHTGASAAAARLTSRRQFGSVARIKEETRDAWIPAALQTLVQDLRFALRLLAKDPRFTLAVVGALALGIGANMTTFTLVNGSVLHKLPFVQPERLVTLSTVDVRHRPMGVSYADVRDWRASTRSLSNVISTLDFSLNLSEEALPAERYLGSLISSDVFDMVGVSPLLGRTFSPDEDRQDAPRVIVIAYTIWQKRYGGDPNVIGRHVKIPRSGPEVQLYDPTAVATAVRDVAETIGAIH